MDRRVVRKILSGDQSATDRWVKETYPGVYRFLCHLTRSQEDSYDLAQQTFLRIRESLPGFRFDCPLRAWVFRIAYREFLHWVRSKSRHPETELLDLQDPRQRLSEDSVLIDAALRELPLEMSEAFWLREVERLSVREVAEALGIPEGTVKSRCYTAKEKLRESLGSTYHPQTDQLEVDHAN